MIVPFRTVFIMVIIMLALVWTRRLVAENPPKSSQVPRTQFELGGEPDLDLNILSTPMPTPTPKPTPAPTPTETPERKWQLKKI
jgi:hypothetical protein